MKSKKIQTFKLIEEGEITEITFDFKESVDYTEQQKKVIKMLTENVHYEFYIIDEKGNYKSLKKEQ